jgi:hypothetical protein
LDSRCRLVITRRPAAPFGQIASAPSLKKHDDELGNLDLFRTAMPGLSYRDASSVVPMLNQEAAAYFWRLEPLAELVLKAVVLKNESAA